MDRETWSSLGVGDVIQTQRMWFLVEKARRGKLTLKDIPSGERRKVKWSDKRDLPMKSRREADCKVPYYTGIYSSIAVKEMWYSLEEGQYLQCGPSIFKVLKEFHDGLVLSYTDSHESQPQDSNPVHWDEERACPVTKTGEMFADPAGLRIVLEEDFHKRMSNLLSCMREKWESLEQGDILLLHKAPLKVTVLDKNEDGSLVLSYASTTQIHRKFPENPCSWDDNKGIVSADGKPVKLLNKTFFSVKKGGAAGVVEYLSKKAEPSVKLRDREFSRLLKEAKERKGWFTHLCTDPELPMPDTFSMALDNILGEGNYTEEQMAELAHLTGVILQSRGTPLL